MFRYNNTVILQFDSELTGNSGAERLVTVRHTATQIKATLYEDLAGTIEIDNPVTSDNLGNYTFVVDSGLYDVIVNEGLIGEYTIKEILIPSNTISLINEPKTLTSGQVDLEFLVVSSNATFYVCGQNADDGRMCAPGDYEIISPTEIRLANSFPEGTIIYGVQNDLEGVVTAGVITWNSRDGNVLPADADYEASQVTFSSSEGLSSNRVGAAIDEVKSITDDNASSISNNADNILDNTEEIAIAKLNDAIYNKQTGTAYTLIPSDRGKTVSMNNAAANVITIDTNANQAILVDAVILLRQLGAGATTITAVAGVSLNGVDGGSVTLDGAYDTASIDQQDVDDWVYVGSGEVA